MEIDAIARELNISEATVRVLIARGLRKIAQAGDAESFATIVRLTRDRSAVIRCGSIECRPEKWAFYA